MGARNRLPSESVGWVERSDTHQLLFVGRWVSQRAQPILRATYCRLEPREIQLGARLSSTPPHSRRDLSNRVLGYFQWRRLDGLARWFGRVFHRLFREWIDAAAGFCGGLVDHRHFDEAGNDKLTGFVQLLVANRRQVFHDSLHIVL